MPKYQIGLDDGRKFEIETAEPVSQQEAEQLVNEQLGQSGSRLEGDIPLPSGQQESPLNLWERFKYSFGNDTGRYTYLRERFPGRDITLMESGKMAVDGIPIDPEGFSITDLPGDIVDVGDEIVRLAGQIGGAVLGTPEAPGAGTIVGGAIGRGVGQSAVTAIGKAFGMRQEELGEVAKDIAMESAIGGVSEGIGLGLRAITKPTIKFLRNLAKGFTRKVGRPIEQTLFNFTGGMQQSSIKRLQVMGVDKILTQSNLDDSALLNIGKKIQTAVVNERTKLGNMVESGKGIIRELNKANIDIQDVRYAFGTKMQKLGLLKSNFTPMKPEVGKLGAGQKMLLNIWKKLRTKQKISPNQALRWRTELDRLIKFNDKGVIAITNAENTLAQAMRSELKNKLIQVSPEFAKANASYANFIQLEDMLGGKIDDITKAENFLKKIFTGPQVFEDALIDLNNKVAPADRFMSKLKDVVAARDFASQTFRGIRTGIFSGLLGQMFGGGNAILPGAALGIALSTPKVAGKVIGTRQLLNRLVGRANIKGIQHAPAITSRILSSLISRAMTDVKKNKNNTTPENSQ